MMSDFESLLRGPSTDKANPLPHVLVIDDDEAVRDSLDLVLSEKYQVRCCPDARSGVDTVTQETSTVILDIKMEGYDGFWAHSMIRKTNEFVPIIFHSAYQDLKDPFEIMNQFRPFGYLRKEGDLTQLLEMVARAVRHFDTLKGIRQIRTDLKGLRA